MVPVAMAVSVMVLAAPGADAASLSRRQVAGIASASVGASLLLASIGTTVASWRESSRLSEGLGPSPTGFPAIEYDDVQRSLQKIRRLQAGTAVLVGGGAIGLAAGVGLLVAEQLRVPATRPRLAVGWSRGGVSVGLRGRF